MADAIITVILTQLGIILERQIRKELALTFGVEKDVKKLKTTFKSIQAVLADAEKRQVKDESVKLWVEKLKEISYDTEDVLTEWITSIEKAEIEEAHDMNQSESPTKKVCSFINFSCLGCHKVLIRRDIALKVKEINGRLDSIADEKGRYKVSEVVADEGYVGLKAASFTDMSEVRGREEDTSTLIRKVLSLKNQKEGLNVVSVLGMGGIGKTTLAQVVYHSNDVIEHFDRRIWVSVSEPFDEVRIAEAILKDVEGTAPCLHEPEPLLRKIRGYIAEKKFLLVMDDVWTEDYRKWEQLLNSLKTGGAGSTILVTTRNERVAKAMGSSYELQLGLLSDHDSWSLFSRIAFSSKDPCDCKNLEDVCRKIADKCKGLPLTVKTIGSLMRFKNTLQDWESVLNSEFWNLEHSEKLFPPLMLSYCDLPSEMKQCFLFCAFFPKDHIIDAGNLIKLWMAQGYLTSSGNMEMEITGAEYLHNLAMRSFFQELKYEKDGKRISSVKMHDMVHDLAQYLSKNECSVMEVNSNLVRKIELPSSKSYRHLTLIRTEDNLFPTSVPNAEKLRTFWVQSFYDSPPIISQTEQIEPELLCRLTCVRALDLSRNRVGGLPKDVGKLINLKYLNLSHNPFWELPSTLCSLYNLLTLKLSSCDHLRKLPYDIQKLAKLRHLELERTDSLKTMPKGIGKLSSLHTLTKFIILPGKDGSTCGVGDLCNLNKVQGSLRIEGLGYVGDPDEAKRAELHKKIHISDMFMDLGPSTQTRSKDEVIDAFAPHENLQSLQISSFGGNKLPTWMVRLTNLQKLYLRDCHNCTNFPPLGKLPSLSTLHIEGANSIVCIGLEFLGMEVNEQMNFNREDVEAFPKLKKLKISNLENWEDWEVMNRAGNGDYKIMPRLRCLKISTCRKLKGLPPLLLSKTQISKLRLHNCPLLYQLYQKKIGDKWNQISHISNARIS